MIETTQAQAHHQHHRQFEFAHKINLIQLIVQWCGPTTDAFDHHRIGLLGETRIGIDELCEIRAHAHRTGRELRRGRSLQRIRIDVLVHGARIACCLQTQRVVVAPAIGRAFASAGDRLHADNAQARSAQTLDQCDARHGFTHTGIGAGHKQATGGFGNGNCHISAVVRLMIGGMRYMVNAAGAAATLRA